MNQAKNQKKFWEDNGSKFYNKSMKSWLEKNNIEMYSTHNDRKSVVAERFIRTLKTKIYKYMNSLSKNVYIDKLDDIVNVDVNDKDTKFKIGDHITISKYKKHFC